MIEKMLQLILSVFTVTSILRLPIQSPRTGNVSPIITPDGQNTSIHVIDDDDDVVFRPTTTRGKSPGPPASGELNGHDVVTAKPASSVSDDTSTNATAQGIVFSHSSTDPSSDPAPRTEIMTSIAANAVNASIAADDDDGDIFMVSDEEIPPIRGLKAITPQPTTTTSAATSHTPATVPPSMMPSTTMTLTSPSTSSFHRTNNAFLTSSTPFVGNSLPALNASPSPIMAPVLPLPVPGSDGTASTIPSVGRPDTAVSMTPTTPVFSSTVPPNLMSNSVTSAVRPVVSVSSVISTTSHPPPATLKSAASPTELPASVSTPAFSSNAPNNREKSHNLQPSESQEYIEEVVILDDDDEDEDEGNAKEGKSATDGYGGGNVLGLGADDVAEDSVQAVIAPTTESPDDDVVSPATDAGPAQAPVNNDVEIAPALSGDAAEITPAAPIVQNVSQTDDNVNRNVGIQSINRVNREEHPHSNDNELKKTPEEVVTAAADSSSSPTSPISPNIFRASRSPSYDNYHDDDDDDDDIADRPDDGEDVFNFTQHDEGDEEDCIILSDDETFAASQSQIDMAFFGKVKQEAFLDEEEEEDLEGRDEEENERFISFDVGDDDEMDVDGTITGGKEVAGDAEEDESYVFLDIVAPSNENDVDKNVGEDDEDEETEKVDEEGDEKDKEEEVTDVGSEVGDMQRVQDGDVETEDKERDDDR